MKNKILMVCLLLVTGHVFAQDVSKNTITTNGSAQKILYPQSYKIRFILQEENKGENSKGIIKTSLDSLKLVFFANVKAYGLKESDFWEVKRSSTPYNGRISSNLYNVIYELKGQKFDMAQKLVDDLRVTGLKGVVAKPQYPIVTKVQQDSLFSAAVQDAYANAVSLAKHVDKTVGEVYSINNGYGNNVRDYNTDYDPTDIYSLSKFEISMTDTKLCQITVSIVYELKGGKM